MNKFSMILSSAVLSSLIAGSAALAQTSAPAPTPAKPARVNPCTLVNATEAQKSQIKTAVFQFAQTKINDKAAVATARLNYRKLAADSNASYADAQAAAAAQSAAVSKLITDKMALRTQILFQILTPAQRGPAMKCEMLKKKMRRNRRNGGGNGKGARGNGQRGNGHSGGTAEQTAEFAE